MATPRPQHRRHHEGPAGDWGRVSFQRVERIGRRFVRVRRY